MKFQIPPIRAAAGERKELSRPEKIDCTWAG
jgi:hypothetical protein